MTHPVRVRFAPSPTGYLHVGGARTALFNWLFARQTGGVFVLRMEDTDAERNTEAARQTIFEGLRRLGLDPDEGPEQGGPHGPYSQSERGEQYAEAIAQLVASKAVYPCFATREELAELRAQQEAAGGDLGYDGRYRDLDPEEAARRVAAGEPHTLRLRVPEGETVLEDLVRGTVRVDHADVEDIILVRADGTPVYNLAVVVDDHHMKITHVLRGEDHLTNTFKQVLLFKVLGWPLPQYAHLPLILGPQGEGKLSKRKHPEAAIEHYLEAGYDEDALINWLALIGWSDEDEQEILSRDELVKRFKLEGISKGGARLPIDKLDHLSGHYIREMALEDALPRLRAALVAGGLLQAEPDAENEARFQTLAPHLQSRTRTWKDAVEQARWAFQPLGEWEAKARKNLRKVADASDMLRAYAGSLPDPLPSAEQLESQARGFCEARELGFGKFVHPVRASLTGRAGGPPLFDCIVALGREESVARLRAGADLADEAAKD